MRNAEGKLPVVTDVVESGGCDRRTVLGGLAVGALVAGCRIDDPGATADAAGPTDAPTDGAPGTGFELCGAEVCVDLTHPQNVKLLDVGGTRNIVQGTKKITIVRTSATAFSTVTSVCTHTGCTVAYKVGPDQIQCPCHGSKYMTNGTLISGPATRDLTNFNNVFDVPGNLLTITLV